jgi:hypothetical protein
VGEDKDKRMGDEEESGELERVRISEGEGREGVEKDNLLRSPIGNIS